MATQALNNESLPGNHSAVAESSHGRHPLPHVLRADTEFREINVDQLSESDFEGMKDSGLDYSDHDYFGSNPCSTCPSEKSQFPALGGVSELYLRGESTDPCLVERTDNRPAGTTSSITAPASAMRKMQLGATKFHPVKDLALINTQQPGLPGKSVSWKTNVTQPKKSGRPPKNEAREMSGDRLMGRAMVKAGMQAQPQPHQLIPSTLHHSQGVHPMQDYGHIHGAAPLVTPARGPKIMPRGRSAASAIRRDIPDEGNGGFAMIPVQQPSTSYRSVSATPPKKHGSHSRSAQLAEEAHTREMMEAAQNALAPCNATISGHNIMMNAQNQHHSVVLPVQPVQHQQQQSQHFDDGDLPRTPGKVYTYTPVTPPNPRRTISESQEMNINLYQEPLRTNPDGLPVTPGGNRKIASRSSTPRSRMSISESTGSQGTSPHRALNFVVSPPRQGIIQARPFVSPQRTMQTSVKSSPTTPIFTLTQGPSTMASAQMQMSSNAPMPSLHNQVYQQPPVVTRHLVTSSVGMSYYDTPGMHAAPLITASGSNTYTPRRRKEKETDDAVEAEVSRNVKTILQTEKTQRLSLSSSNNLSPKNETSDEDSGNRGGIIRENKKSTSKRTAQKQSKHIARQSSNYESEEDVHEQSSWLVECICGQTEDDGEEMVACDNCIRWEHVDCIFPRTKTAPKGGYLCHQCDPRPTELTGTMAKEYQERVRKEKDAKSEMELKRKLQERVAKRKEESSRKPHSISRINPSKTSTKIDKPANSYYRDIEKNEYSANAKRFLTISRSSGNVSTTPDIINVLRDHPRAKPLVVEPNTYGLITTKSINNGDYIAELCGLVILQKDCLNRDAPPGSCNEQTFLIEKDGDKIIIDARKSGNYARYVRRSCKPNAELQEIMSGSELHVMIKANNIIDAMTEVKIGMESDWRKNLRSTQGCTCKGDELKTCDVELFFTRKGKNMVSTSRRSLPVNGTTPKGAQSPLRRSVTEKKKSGSTKKVISKKGKKKGTIKLPRHIRKSKGGSTSTADESERDDGTEEYEESTADEKEEKNVIVRRGGRRNTGSISEGKEKEIKKEEECEMPLIPSSRSSARIRNDSEVKKEVESPKKEENMKTGDKRDSTAGGSRKGRRISGIEDKEEIKEVKKEVKEEIKEEPATPVQKKEKKPWPKMDYSLPSERNKPSREERKFQAECERIEKDAKKKRGSSTRGRPSNVTPVGVKKEDKIMSSGKGRGKRKADTEEESARADSSTANASTPIVPSVRKRPNIIDNTRKEEDKKTASPAPSSSLSSMNSPAVEDVPAASPIHTGGKKKWLLRHQEDEKKKAEVAAAAAKTPLSTPSAPSAPTAPSVSSVSVTSRTSTPTRSKRFNKKEERGAVEALMNMGGMDEKNGESLRDEMRRNAIKLRQSLKSTLFSIGNLSAPRTSTARSSTQLPSTVIPTVLSTGPSTPPPLPVTPTPTIPIESAKTTKKSLSIEEYRKRKQTEGTQVGEEKKDDSERKIPPKKSFMPSADASASMSSLPNVKLPELEETVGMDELSRRVYGDVQSRKREGTSTSTTTTPIMGKTQPTPKRQSINDRLKNEFALPILSTPSPLAVSTSITPSSAIIRPPTISPIPIVNQQTPTGGRTTKNRLSDARALNMDPPGVISTPLLSSTVSSSTNSSHNLPSSSISSTPRAAFLQRAASIRSSQK